MLNYLAMQFASFRRGLVIRWGSDLRSIEPIDIRSFRKKMGYFLIGQAAIAGLGICLFLFLRDAGRIDLEFLALVLFAVTEMAFTISRNYSHFACGRLLDIYPQLSPTRGLLLLCASLLCFPLTFVSFIIYLSWKRNCPEKGALPFPYRSPKLAGIGLMLFVLSLMGFAFADAVGKHQIPARPIGYLVANPTTYYIVSLSDELRSMLRLNSAMTGNPDPRMAIAGIKDIAAHHPLSQTGFILALAIDVRTHINMQKLDRKVASVPSVTSQIDLLNDVLTLLEMREHSPPDVLRYNPVAWLEPPGAVEISLITSVQMLIEAKSVDLTYSTIELSLDHLERQARKTETADSADLKNVDSLRARFEALPDYRFYRVLKSSWIRYLVSRHKV